MPPKKSKAAQAKSKAIAKPSNIVAEDVEPAQDGADETQEVATSKLEESAEVESSKPEESAAAVDEEQKADPEPEAEAKTEVKDDVEKPASKSKTKKRKAENEAAMEPAKDARRSGRGASKATPSTHQLLNYLLSDASLSLCRPEDETKFLEEQGKDLRTYSGSILSPFEELLCAVVLSRPISHRLGHRTIRTILNPPYEFTNPKVIKSFTPEQRHQAMFDAHTQHKEKTANQIGLIADVVAEKFGKNEEDTSLDKMRDSAKKDWDAERDLLQSNIKGLGKTGLDIFFRRVQWLWPEAFPFVDERTARGVEKLGLPKNPDELVKLLNDNWAKLDKNSSVKGDKETQKRRAFVIICERATSADLENKTEAILEAAAARS